MRILFFILFNSFAFSQSCITELSDKTVGSFLYNKNIKIVNDSIDIYVKVNSKGYCYAVDFVSNSKTKFTLSDKVIGNLVNKDLDWVNNDSIAIESLEFDEYQSCGDYLSHRGRNHRYDSYVKHAYSNNIIYIILNSINGYAVLAEHVSEDFLTKNNAEEANGQSIADDWISFNTLIDGLNFLKSDEVINKGIELKKVQDEIIKREDEMRDIPISSIELPYKIKFGMSEQTVANHLKLMFNVYSKTKIDNYMFEKVKKKGSYKEFEYGITENTCYLKIQLCFLHDKIIKIGYSHWDKNHSRIDDLDLKVKTKLTAIKKDYYLLFDILFSDSQIEGEHQIWSIKEKEKLVFEEDFFSTQEFQRNKEIQNNIGKKI